MTNEKETINRFKEIKVRSAKIDNGMFKIIGIDKSTTIELENFFDEYIENRTAKNKLDLNEVHITKINGSFERCQVLSTNSLAKTAQVYLIDLNHEETVSTLKVQPILTLNLTFISLRF